MNLKFLFFEYTKIIINLGKVRKIWIQACFRQQSWTGNLKANFNKINQLLPMIENDIPNPIGHKIVITN